MRIVTAVLCGLALAVWFGVSWADPPAPVGRSAPALPTPFATKPGLTVTVQSVRVLPPTDPAKLGYRVNADERVVEVKVSLLDESGATNLVTYTEGIALFSSAYGKVGELLYQGSVSFDNSNPPGSWVKASTSLFFRAPGNVEEMLPNLTLRFPVERFRPYLVALSFGEKGKPLSLPVTQTAGGVSVTLVGAQVGTYRTVENGYSVTAAGTPPDQDKPHLILTYVLHSVSTEAHGAETIPVLGKVTTKTGGVYQPGGGMMRMAVSEAVAPGLRFYESTGTIHILEVHDLADLETVAISIRRWIPVDDNWLSLTPPAAPPGGKP